MLRLTDERKIWRKWKSRLAVRAHLVHTAAVEQKQQKQKKLCQFVFWWNEISLNWISECVCTIAANNQATSSSTTTVAVDASREQQCHCIPLAGWRECEHTRDTIETAFSHIVRPWTLKAKSVVTTRQPMTSMREKQMELACWLWDLSGIEARMKYLSIVCVRWCTTWDRCLCVCVSVRCGAGECVPKSN